MSVKVEKLEKNMAKLTIEVEAEKVEKAIENVYRKMRGRIQVQGFRKGKAPRSVIERMYGKEVFYEDAIEELVRESYPEAAENCGEDVASSPTVDVVQIESGKPFIYDAKVALKPEVGLGKYKGIEVEKADIEVTDKDVEEELERVRNLNARNVDVTDRAIQKDDTVNLDYEGFVDGKAFDGGKDEGHNLTIGSGAFIPGFEDGLIGKNVGEDCDVTVTFPEDYHEKSLAGKEAVFKCHINGIRVKELPELNDEFASDVSEFETLVDYKKDLEKKLTERKENEVRSKREDECVRALVEDSEIDLPEAMVETQQKQMVNEFLMQLQMQGLDPRRYMQMIGSSQDRMMEQMRPQAIERIKGRLVLEAVAAKEKLQATDEEFEAKLKEMAEQYHMELDKIKEMMSGKSDEKQVREDLAVEKAVKFLVDNAKEGKMAKNTKEAV